MMLETIRNRQAEIAALCERYGIARLDIFGSAITDAFDPVASDIDFVIEFSSAGRERAFDNYFGFREALGRLLGRPVELVTKSSIRNPVFRAEIERTAESVYAVAG